MPCFDKLWSGIQPLQTCPSSHSQVWKKIQGSSCWQNVCYMLKPANTRHVLKSQNIDFKQVDFFQNQNLPPISFNSTPSPCPHFSALAALLAGSLPPPELWHILFLPSQFRIRRVGGGFCDPPLSKLIIRNQSTKKMHKDNKLTGPMNPRKAMTQHFSTANNSFEIRKEILTKPKCSLQSTITCDSLLRKGLQI